MNTNNKVVKGTFKDKTFTDRGTGRKLIVKIFVPEETTKDDGLHAGPQDQEVFGFGPKSGIVS